MKKNKETKKSLKKVQFKTPPKKNDKAKAKSTNSRNRLGMGLSSLMSKDQELASVIRSKVKSQATSSSLKIQIPKLSTNENSKISILNVRKEDQSQKVVPIQSLVPGKFQPRKNFDQTELEELAESIRSNGVLQPILVRPVVKDGNSFEIIAGERRWRASQLAKLHQVPVIIRDFDDETVVGVAMIENLQRTDLNLVEEAEGYRTMMNVFAYTQEKLSAQLGKSRSHIANVLRILNLSKNIRKHIISGRLSFGHARALITLAPEQADNVADDIITKDLSVRKTENIVNSIKRKERASSTFSIDSNQTAKNSNVENLERELTNLLGLKVLISHKSNNSGNLSIFYKSLDQIQPVIDKLKWRPK